MFMVVINDVKDVVVLMIVIIFLMMDVYDECML